MQIIEVSSLPLKEVIDDLANAFNSTIVEKSGEYILSLPNHVGKGCIRGIDFEGGLGIIQYDCTFREDTEIQFTINEVHPLKFLYVISGKLFHRFASDDNVHELHPMQNAIVASLDGQGHILEFKKNIQTCIYSLEINRGLFQKKVNFHIDKLDRKLKHLFNDVRALESFYYEGDYSLKLADLFNKIEKFDTHDFLYGIFMESMAYQTLVLQISQYIDDQRQENHRQVLRKSEIAGIIKAAEYIDKNLAQYKSLPILTEITGLNGSKLQEGFKHLYNKTVNQYVTEARLDLAKELLINTDDSISEIVYRIGLSSKSHFSSIFKEAYHVLPSVYRRKYYKGSHQ